MYIYMVVNKWLNLRVGIAVYSLHILRDIHV